MVVDEVGFDCVDVKLLTAASYVRLQFPAILHVDHPRCGRLTPLIAMQLRRNIQENRLQNWVLVDCDSDFPDNLIELPIELPAPSWWWW